MSLHIVVARQSDAILGMLINLTLIFPIATLHLFMDPFLHLAFQDASPRRLVKPGNFQNMCSIYPVIGTPSHDTVTVDFELINRDLATSVRLLSQACARCCSTRLKGQGLCNTRKGKMKEYSHCYK